MKRIVQLSALVLTCLLTSTATYAADKLDWKACEKEVKEFKCTGDDKSIWSCLEKNDEKLSKTC